MAWRWGDDPDELRAIQTELAAATEPPWHPPAGGIDAGGCFVCAARHVTGPGASGDPAWAAAVVVRDGQVVRHAVVRDALGWPYTPGLLALRDGPILESAVRRADPLPDVLLVDATGRDHPRRAGMARHLGAVLDVPTVGVTHRPLVATGPWPAPQRGARAPLVLDGVPVAAWVRTTAHGRPVVVHPGWRTDLDTAMTIVLALSARYRTPEPIRQARRLARSTRALDTARRGARAGHAG